MKVSRLKVLEEIIPVFLQIGWQQKYTPRIIMQFLRLKWEVDIVTILL
jgi:hypothetical protein